jgi:hypothetical protein
LTAEPPTDDLPKEALPGGLVPYDGRELRAELVRARKPGDLALTDDRPLDDPIRADDLLAVLPDDLLRCDGGIELDLAAAICVNTNAAVIIKTAILEIFCISLAEASSRARIACSSSAPINKRAGWIVASEESIEIEAGSYRTGHRFRSSQLAALL